MLRDRWLTRFTLSNNKIQVMEELPVATSEKLTDLHKALIQFMMRAQIVSSYALTENIFRKLYDIEFQPEDTSSVDYVANLESAITLINNSLHDLGFVIKRFKKQSSTEMYYVFINTSHDEISKLMTTYSPKDIQAINRIIDTIIKSPEGSIGEIDASNVVTQATDGSYTKSDSLKLLTSLIYNRWLDHDPSQKTYMLSGRLLAELGSTLKSQYGSQADNVF